MGCLRGIAIYLVREALTSDMAAKRVPFLSKEEICQKK